MTPKFAPNEPVIHPNHGLGSIGRITEREIAGRTVRLLSIQFPRTTLTLWIPEGRLASAGLRPPCSRAAIRSALSIIAEPPAAFAGHPAQRAVRCEEKINSGEPALIAEILRDLKGRGRGARAVKVYQEALLRLAEELAIVEGIGVAEAEATIEHILETTDGEQSD